VGTIADWIRHEKNGHIVPVGDPRALSRSIERLLHDHDHREELRAAALALRPSLSLESGVAFWQSALWS
jgi:glycosyltransferase involved in cell wall biosynthesis